MSPHPTALRCLVRDEDVEKHRSISCVEYDACLDTALRHSWRSWSCGRCQLFRQRRVLRAAKATDEVALRPYA